MTILFDTGRDAYDGPVPLLRGEVECVDSFDGLNALLRTRRHDLVVVGPGVDAAVACSFAAAQRLVDATVGVVLVRRELSSGVLRDAMVAGVRDVVLVDDPGMIEEACIRSREVSEALRGRREYAPAGVAPVSGEVVTVFAGKGGCGKTTVATNLATAFARAGRRTCLVDLDLAFGDVAIAMQLQPVRTLADAVGISALDETAVRSLVTHHDSGVDMILAPVEPGMAETISGELVGHLLELLQKLYDVVVVDTPPAFTDHVLAALDRAHHCVLITTLDVPALKNLKLTLETLEMLGYPRERWRVLLNRSDAKVGLSVQDVERTLRTPIAVQVPSSRVVPASINRGVPIVLDQPGHAVSAAITRLAAALSPAEHPRSKPARRQFLRRRVEVAS